MPLPPPSAASPQGRELGWGLSRRYWPGRGPFPFCRLGACSSQRPVSALQPRASGRGGQWGWPSLEVGLGPSVGSSAGQWVPSHEPLLLPSCGMYLLGTHWVFWGWGCGRGWYTGPVLRFACAWKALGCAQCGMCDQLPASPCDLGRVYVHAQDVPEEVRFLTCRRGGWDAEGPSPGGPVRLWPASRESLEGEPRAQQSAGAVGLGAQAAR